MQYFRVPSTPKLNEGLELKQFYSTHALIKTKQYFINLLQKIEFAAKKEGWLCQGFSIHRKESFIGKNG